MQPFVLGLYMADCTPTPLANGKFAATALLHRDGPDFVEEIRLTPSLGAFDTAEEAEAASAHFLKTDKQKKLVRWWT